MENLLAQLEHPVDQCLGTRRTARDIDIHGQNLIHARHNGIRIRKGAARNRTRPHCDHIFWLGHLLVEAHNRICHLPRQRPRNDQEIRLARTRAEDLVAEPRKIEARRRRAHHLDRTAGKPRGQRPDRARVCPAQELVKFHHEDIVTQTFGYAIRYLHERSPFLHA